MLNMYALAPGHNNVAGLIPLSEIIDGEPTFTYASSVGTFRAAVQFKALDGITYEDGPDAWEWTFGALLPSDVEWIETEILGGAISAEVTVETKNRWGTAFIQLNAVLTMPSPLPRPESWESFGPLIFSFTGGRPTS